MSMRAEYTNQNLTFYDDVLSPPRGTFVAEQFPVLAGLNDMGTAFELKDDFFDLSTGATGRWQVVKGTGGSVALTASVLGGMVDIPTAASASDYQTFATQKAWFALAANKPIAFEASFLLTEAATNAASWFFGLTSTTTSGFISTAGATPSSYSGAMFWKATGGLTLSFETANATTKNTIASLQTVVSGTQYVVGCILNPNDGTTAKVTPYVGKIAAGVRSGLTIGTTQNLTIASLAKMFFQFGVMCGSGGTAETLTVDWVRILAAR